MKLLACTTTPNQIAALLGPNYLVQSFGNPDTPQYSVEVLNADGTELKPPAQTQALTAVAAYTTSATKLI